MQPQMLAHRKPKRIVYRIFPKWNSGDTAQPVDERKLIKLLYKRRDIIPTAYSTSGEGDFYLVFSRSQYIIN